MNDTETELNAVEVRCFRDIADGDYIAARTCFKAQLWVQYYWSGQQALEKYFKCILLLNRIPSKNINHDIKAALNLINERTEFEIKLDLEQKEVFERISSYGTNRYLEGCYFVRRYDLHLLDRLIWYVRQFCFPLGYILGIENRSEELFKKELAQIERTRIKPDPQSVKGELGKILNKKLHPARSALVWNNLFFTTNSKRRITVNTGLAGVNAPLSLRPKLIYELQKFIQLSKAALTDYQKLAEMQDTLQGTLVTVVPDNLNGRLPATLSKVLDKKKRDL